MKKKIVITSTALVTATVLFSSITANAGNPGTCTPSATNNGADVIVGDLQGISNFTNVGSLDALSLGTTSCNIGTDPLNWIAGGPFHPVIGGNLYKLKTVDGALRFEQVGQSWLKYAFCALSQSICCSNCNANAGCASNLGVGCSDPYTSARNATQSGLGPKWQVNAYTGQFPGGHVTPSGGNAGRLEVDVADLETSNIDVRYYGEAQYITFDDASLHNNNNNASYRQVNVTGGPTNFTFSLAGVTQRAQPALNAWKVADPSVTIIPTQIPGEGLFHLGYKVTDLGNGTWHYEFAIFNQNSDRSGQSFSVPVPDCVNVTNIGFHDVAYRYNDGLNGTQNFDGTDWAAVHSGGMLTWSTQTFAQNANANALRWGTLYNFRFDADQPPVAADAVLGLFKTGNPGSVNIAVQGPAPCAAACAEDLFPVGKPDGQVGPGDLGQLLAGWGPCKAPCPADIAPVGAPDGNVGPADLGQLLSQWGQCP